jgi:outer membrane biosynthesis protein TonB
MRISSRLFTRAIAVLLLALALNMAAAAFMGGGVAEASNVVYGPQETPTVTLPPWPSATPTKPPPPTQPPPTNPPPTSPPQSTNTPPPQATNTPPPAATPTPTKIIVLPQTGQPDGGTGANMALIAGALATAGAGLFLASRRTNR